MFSIQDVAIGVAVGVAVGVVVVNFVNVKIAVFETKKMMIEV